MTMTASLLLDVVGLLILIFFLVQGVRRGFILTLCSLLALVLALVGGWYLSVHYDEPVKERLEPILLERMLPDDSAPTEPPAEQDLDALIQDQAEQAAQAAQSAIITQQCAHLAGLAAKVLLFLTGFLGVLLVWLILCHALNLVANLPGLHFLNKSLGGILGFLKGVLLLLLLRWLLFDILRLIPDQVMADSYLFSFLPGFSVLPSWNGLTKTW